MKIFYISDNESQWLLIIVNFDCIYFLVTLKLNILIQKLEDFTEYIMYYCNIYGKLVGIFIPSMSDIFFLTLKMITIIFIHFTV